MARDVNLSVKSFDIQLVHSFSGRSVVALVVVHVVLVLANVVGMVV